MHMGHIPPVKTCIQPLQSYASTCMPAHKHVLNGATMIPLVMTTFGKLGPSAESYLNTLADVACSTGFVDRGVWLRVAKQFLSCASVRGRGVVFRHYYKSIAKCAGKDCRDGAVVPFE